MQTLLQAKRDKPSRKPRSNYPDLNARKTNEKNDKKRVCPKYSPIK
jgi:hypothetical protein